MNKSVSTAIMIAVSLTLAAALCGVIFTGLLMSKDIADTGYEKIVDNVRVSQIETVRTFEKWKDKGIPVSAAFILLKENPSLVMNLKCNICGTTTIGGEVGDCLKSHMRGRVKIVLTEEISGGTYTAVINIG